MPVHKLSQMGSVTTNKIDYPSMLAGYGDFGALTRIAYQAGTGTTDDIIFNNIPQTFQDLFVVVNARLVNFTGAPTLNFRFQVPGSAYSNTILLGNGSTASSNRNSTTVSHYTDGYTQSLSTSFSTSATIHILNYRSTVNKTSLWRVANDRNGSGYTAAGVGLVQTSSALTQLVVSTGWGGTYFTTDSTFTIYGVKASAA